jgi:hypothetical protein
MEVGMSAPLEDRLPPVLDALTFPAEWWEIVTVAEEYGADLRSRVALRALTRRTYFSREMILREVAEMGRAASSPVEESRRSHRIPPRAPRSRISGPGPVPTRRHEHLR